MSSSDQPAADDVTALRELEQEIADLRDRVADLEERLDNTDDGPDYPAATDWRDARVLEAIDAGDDLHVTDLRELYRSEAGIRSKDTLSERVRDLVTSDAFERVDRQTYRYQPGGGR